MGVLLLLSWGILKTKREKWNFLKVSALMVTAPFLALYLQYTPGKKSPNTPLSFTSA